MTNFEKIKSMSLEEMAKFIPCLRGTVIDDIESNLDCDRYEPYRKCNECIKNWLMQEYKEPEIDWSKVAVDAKILVSDNGEDWHKCYFAEYKDGKVYAFADGQTSWSVVNKRMWDWHYAKLAEEVEQNE